jgi:hypothetical protein
MINPSNFRDKILTGISIRYGWDGSQHCALLSVCDSNGNEQIYQLDGLLEFSVYDDFGTLHISHVKILHIGNQLYLSLDPYDEQDEIADYDRDNIWFQFSEIALHS